MNRSLIEKQIFFYFLIILAVVLRLLPHPMNFAPIGALGLFAGAYLSDRRSWLVPVLALFISDFFIGFYNIFIMLSVYLSFALSAFVGRCTLSKRRTVIRIGISATASATILFVLSNFTLWATGLYYPLTMDGLIFCFVRAIPFYGNTLAGDLFYAGILFGSWEYAGRYWLKRDGETQPA